MVERCNICYEPADSDIDCNGPRHMLIVKDNGSSSRRYTDSNMWSICKS